MRIEMAVDSGIPEESPSGPEFLHDRMPHRKTKIGVADFVKSPSAQDSAFRTQGSDGTLGTSRRMRVDRGRIRSLNSES